MTSKDLEKLRKRLPKGARERLAVKYNCSLGHVSNVLTGLRTNEPMIISAVHIVSKHASDLKQAKTALESIQ